MCGINAAFTRSYAKKERIFCRKDTTNTMLFELIQFLLRGNKLVLDCFYSAQEKISFNQD